MKKKGLFFTKEMIDNAILKEGECFYGVDLAIKQKDYSVAFIKTKDKVVVVKL